MGKIVPICIHAYACVGKCEYANVETLNTLVEFMTRKHKHMPPLPAPSPTPITDISRGVEE